MRKFKVLLGSGERKVMARDELSDLLKTKGYRLRRSSVNGELYNGNLLIFKYQIIE